MKTTVHYFSGVTATVYQMEAGEKVARHQHPNEHTTGVIAGRSEVQIWRDSDNYSLFEMTPGVADVTLGPNLDHEVRALETPTIVIHMTAGGYGAATDTGLEGIPGGVTLHDGTVVPHGS